MKNLIFTGSCTAIVTPFYQDGTINYDKLEQLVEFQIENGTDAIVVCGTTGESAAMDNDEHLEEVKFVIDKVNKRIPVIAGTGSNDTKHCVELSKAAKDFGADALLLVTPYYNKTSQKGLVDSFSYVANSVKMPIVLYNVPARTGVNIAPETYYELSKNPYVVATKEASGDVSLTIKIMAMCGDNLTIYSGDDLLTYPMMTLGSKGVISVFSNAFPAQMHSLCSALLCGDLKDARNILMKYSDLMLALFKDISPMPIKEVMNMLGHNVGKCRMPLTTVSPELQVILRRLLVRHGFLECNDK